MIPNDPSSGAPSANHATSWRERWFAGVTWNAIALVGVACLANAVRHRFMVFGEDSLAVVAQRFATVSIVMALTMLAVVATINRVPSAPRWRYPALAFAVLISTATGAAIVGVIEARGWLGWLDSISRQGGLGWWLYYGVLLRYGVFVFLFAAVFVFYRLREEHEEVTRRAEVDRARSEQQMDEARLQVLQAQIEPHFLFNTLANVRRLYQTDPVAAESMLENLMRYLAVALPQMRVADSTLDRETELTESYLEIQRMRMGRRLEFSIDIPAPLRDAQLPPMMLLTLAENAIKHGLAPLPEGGSLRVSAVVNGSELQLRVEDSGRGFTQSSGGGTGLANIRARLAGMYGAAGRLTLAHNAPRGVIATIALPYATARFNTAAQ